MKMILGDAQGSTTGKFLVKGRRIRIISTGCEIYSMQGWNTSLNPLATEWSCDIDRKEEVVIWPTALTYVEADTITRSDSSLLSINTRLIRFDRKLSTVIIKDETISNGRYSPMDVNDISIRTESANTIANIPELAGGVSLLENFISGGPTYVEKMYAQVLAEDTKPFFLNVAYDVLSESLTVVERVTLHVMPKRNASGYCACVIAFPTLVNNIDIIAVTQNAAVLNSFKLDRGYQLAYPDAFNLFN